MKFLLLLTATVIGALGAEGRPEESKVDSHLLSKLRQCQDPAELPNIIISFKEGTGQVLPSIGAIRFATRKDKLYAIHDNLIAHAERVQAKAKVLGGEFDQKTLWVSNQMYVRKATLDLVQSLSQLDEVIAIREEVVVYLDTLESGPVFLGRQNSEGEWGIKKIQAVEAQEFLKNATASAAPVVVSTIDTGARYTHEALRDNWLGEYGWFDPYDKNELPMDQNGHGTHTTGTICGKGGIGVYPDAKWISCRGCSSSSCTQSALLECAEFILCPTLPNGTDPRCEFAPNLVSNSWGGGRGAEWFDAAISSFHAANIIPLFSIGNSGPACNSANSPGDRAVIGVGSTTEDDMLSSFSSVGPTMDGRMKPDIAAPGSEVISAYNTADNAYRSLSGTSMACPHAAGLTSLLFAFNPNLDFQGVQSYMNDGAETEPLGSDDKVCEGKPDNVFPNHHFGYGRINALRSLVLVAGTKT